MLEVYILDIVLRHRRQEDAATQAVFRTEDISDKQVLN